MGGKHSQLWNCFQSSATNRAVGDNHQNILHRWRQSPDALFASSDPLEETLGHSFSYFRSSSRFLSSTPSDRYLSPTHYPCLSPRHDDCSNKSRTGLPGTGFRTISGASVSANSFTPRTVLEQDVDDDGVDSSNLCNSGCVVNGMFESSSPFSAEVPIFSRVGRKEVPAKCDGMEAEVRIYEDINVQWALGKAGEDRVHVVVSEEHQWLFFGIYDGFNGPDAPEFLMDNFFRAMYNELQGLFWEVELDQPPNVASEIVEIVVDISVEPQMEDTPPRSGKRRKVGPVEHELVLNAMSRALDMTEADYLDMNDKFLGRNPELALMGSCLLVVLMRDEDVYVMNVGDSRAIVAQSEQQEQVGPSVDLEEQAENGSRIEGIVEEPTNTLSDKVNEMVKNHSVQVMSLTALQLSTDHSTSIEEEVLRIKIEHPDDSQCIVNERVKGRLMVTRAFGAGFLKHPKWNDPLLEMFRTDYIGTAPYVSCTPSLRHHKLGRRDQFLILSSDGLYQYLTNQEVVSHVGSFMEKSPEGNPAQHLIEELLYRAAKKAGMDILDLLDIPHGDRRKYHDDVTVMVVSLEGGIWKSSGKYL